MHSLQLSELDNNGITVATDSKDEWSMLLKPQEERKNVFKLG